MNLASMDEAIGSEDMYGFHAVRKELERAESEIDGYHLLQKFKPVIDDLLLKLLNEVNYSSVYPFVICNKGGKRNSRSNPGARSCRGGVLVNGMHNDGEVKASSFTSNL